MHVEYVGQDAIVSNEQVAFTYQVAAETPREFNESRTRNHSLDWSSRTNFLGDYVVHPFGSNNDLPNVIREVVQNNYIAPGILKKKTQLLWGSGPKLFKEVFKDGKLVKEWQDNPEIQAWLEDWDAESYILSCCVDYHHMEGVSTRFELSRGSRIGKNWISRLEHVPSDKFRLATHKDSLTTSKNPTHGIVTDWGFNHINSILAPKVYDLFDFRNPFKSRNSVHYSNMYSFCTDYYTVPDLYGSLEWLHRSTAIPLILKALSKNSINLKYHVISPQAWWDKAEKDIKENCTKRAIPYKSKYLDQYKQKMLTSISEILSGEENTGKYWHTSKTLTVDGTNILEHGWEIKVIDQKIKDFVESQILISERADRAVSAGIGLHGALGNVNDGGKADSGSEQIYALKNYMATGVDIPEMIVLKSINYAIKANFPGSGLKLGFYHIQPEKEQDISPSKRSINNQAA
ncbi:hypothetical protein ACX0HA_08995 [Flavobacterium hauense]